MLLSSSTAGSTMSMTGELTDAPHGRREAAVPATPSPVGSAARRGLALATLFWVVVTGLLAARVALFDEITASRIASAVSTQIAALGQIVLR